MNVSFGTEKITLTMSISHGSELLHRKCLLEKTIVKISQCPTWPTHLLPTQQFCFPSKCKEPLLGVHHKNDMSSQQLHATAWMSGRQVGVGICISSEICQIVFEWLIYAFTSLFTQARRCATESDSLLQRTMATWIKMVISDNLQWSLISAKVWWLNMGYMKLKETCNKMAWGWGCRGDMHSCRWWRPNDLHILHKLQTRQTHQGVCFVCLFSS